jgi:hypothetical protein
LHWATIDDWKADGVRWGRHGNLKPLMTIQITRPEVEALINERLQSGSFKDAEDVILQALQASPPTMPPAEVPVAKDIAELFAPLRGLNLDFSRIPSTGRPVDL